MKNYLFVCQHNFTRSRYGAEFFRGFLKGKKKDAKVYSAGIGLVSFFTGRRVNREMLKIMDLIFVMEDYMKDSLIDKFRINKNKIVVLNIEDKYGFLKRRSLDDLDKIFESKNFERYL
jgi:predicted protein tyrosine phosphatase